MKLVAIKKITGTIKLKSGLHIGAGNMEMHIGGTDSNVIKHPHTLQPYIPGSSIKGKIRSLLELSLGLINYTNGKVVDAKTFSAITREEDKKNAEMILKLFGCGAGNDDEKILVQIGPSRASFADSFVNKNWLNEHIDYTLTEIKSENSIDRKTSKASNPRFFERVPEGIEFDFFISVKEFENDDFGALFELLKKGLKLLELDALGGSGSRGYGRIEFLNLSLDSQSISLTDVSF